MEDEWVLKKHTLCTLAKMLLNVYDRKVFCCPVMPLFTSPRTYITKMSRKVKLIPYKVWVETHFKNAITQSVFELRRSKITCKLFKTCKMLMNFFPNIPEWVGVLPPKSTILDVVDFSL